jgi:hypothetical protein
LFDLTLLDSREQVNLLLTARYDAFHTLHSSHVSVFPRVRTQPDNVGFKADGTLKLFDFGLARCVKRRTRVNARYDMTGETVSHYTQ